MSDERREHNYVTESFEQLADRLSRTTVQAPDPNDVWALLTEAPEDALVQLLGDDPALRTIDHARFAELDPVRPAYGLDAGSTGGIQLQTGHRVCRCRAMLGVTGEKSGAWASRTYLQAAIDPFTGFEPYYASSLDETVYGAGSVANHTLALPAPTDEYLSTDDLVTLLQFVTEGLHLQRVVNALDGPLYLDGALVPLGPAARTELTTATSGTNPWADLTDFALTAFATAVARHVERDYPVFAISKTQETAALVETLTAVADEQMADRWTRPTAASDSPLPWHTDRQFVSHLLGARVDESAHPRQWVYTPWLVQSEIYVPRTDRRKRPVTSEQLAYYSAESLERAYCFVRVPGGNGIYRVETPLSALDGLSPSERHRIQQRVLRSMAAQKGTATPIARADDRVGLPYHARKELQSIVEGIFAASETTNRTVPEHNRDIRWLH